MNHSFRKCFPVYSGAEMAKRQVPDCGLCFFSLGYLDFSSNPLTTLSDMARYHQDFGEIVNIFCRKILSGHTVQLRRQKQHVSGPRFLVSDNQYFERLEHRAPDPPSHTDRDIEDGMISFANPSIGRWS